MCVVFLLMSAYLPARERESRAVVQCENEPTWQSGVFEGCSRSTVRQGQQNAKGPTHPLSVSFPHYLQGRNVVAAPAPQNAAALVPRQINGLLDPPLPSTLKRHAECMKRLGDNASPGACLQGLKAYRDDVCRRVDKTKT